MTSASLLVARLHLRDSREIAFEDRVSKLFQRVGSGLEVGRLHRRRRFFEQMIRRVQLSSEPFRDSRAAVVRLIAELTCELPLDLVREQSDVLRAMIELGISKRDERKRTGTASRILVDRLASTG